MRKRLLWIALGVLAVLWLVPALFVAFYDPSVPHAPGQAGIASHVERVLGHQEPQFFLFSHGYTKHWTVETWNDETTADKTSVSYYVERGGLDRQAGTFRLTLSFVENHAEDLEGVRLFVTSVDDWSGDDESVWTRVAEAAVKKPGAEVAALTCTAVVSASTTAYRLEEVRKGVQCCGFSQSILTAPTLVGRVYDRIAWLPFFSWVPDLR